MILYGCAVTDGDTFARFAEAGVRRLTPGAGGAELLAQPSVGSVARNYNLLCGRAAEREDLEALVLFHQDVEIVDPGFSADRALDARRPRGGGRRLRRGDRGAGPGLVGGVDHLGVGDAALRGVRRRRRDPGVSWRRDEKPELRRHGRGRRDRRLPDRALAMGGAQPVLRRESWPAATATTSTSASRPAPPGARW